MVMMNKASDRMYEDFDPVSDFISEEGCDTFILYVPGFKKEQLKVQLTTSRILRISGERPIGDNKWRQFTKEFRISPNVDTKEITAKFEGGILHIRQPKLITLAKDGEHDKLRHAEELTKPQSSKPQAEKESDGFATPPSEFPGSRESESKGKEKVKEDSTRREDEQDSSKGGDMKTMRGSAEKRKELAYGSRLIKELKKPEKQKRLGAFALMLLVLTLLGLYMYNTYTGDVQQSGLEYENQGIQSPT